MKLDKLNVLLAEDDENDVILFRRAFAKVEGEIALHVVEDGVEAISYLRGEGRFSDRAKYPFPTMLILDLKMPRVDGLGVLRWLADHEDCAIIPALMFSSSSQSRDIQEAFGLRVNAYFNKPSNPEELASLLNTIFAFWCQSHVPEPPPGRRCS
jgi:CheY-like chemotaxis protein